MTPSGAFPLVVALLSAGLMGVAIQRGATCMVAAVDEVVTKRAYARMGALAEASLWVGGLVAALKIAGWATSSQTQYAVSTLTVAGGMLLGVGAWINRACVFGSVARIGSGQWAWLATPVGFFLGCLVPLDRPAGAPAEPFAHPVLVLGVVGIIAIWRLAETLLSPSPIKHLWHPHRATLLIGVTFFLTMITAGSWAYTDALAELARPVRGMDAHLMLRGAMVVALLAGSVIGGRIAGGVRSVPLRLADVGRCLAGGVMMGLGGQLIPGGNDGLIMLGLPLLLPHAWVAVIAMGLTIAALIALSQRVSRTAPA